MVGSLAGAMATVVAIPLGHVGGGREQLVAWAVLCLWQWQRPDPDLEFCPQRACPGDLLVAQGRY